MEIVGIFHAENRNTVIAGLKRLCDDNAAELSTYVMSVDELSPTPLTWNHLRMSHEMCSVN